MSKQDVIAQANRLLTQLPDDKAAEVVALLTRILSEAGEDADLQAYYTANIHKQQEEELSRDLTSIATHGGSLDWLHDEPDLYTDEDLVENYRGD